MVLSDKYDENFTDKLIGFMESCRFFKFYFKNVCVDGVDKVKEFIAKNDCAVLNYFSNHVSLADYILFRYTMHKEGFRGRRAPRIVAGNNLYFWPFSVLWSKCGGLKFDRGNPDFSYLKKVFGKLKEFTANKQDMLIYLADGREDTKGYNLSTTFLTPAINAFYGGNKNLAIVPVHVHYDEPIESNAGLKLARNLKFLGKLRHLIDCYMFGKRFIVDGAIGKAHLQFGNSVFLEDIVGSNKSETKKNIANFLKEENDYLIEKTNYSS